MILLVTDADNTLWDTNSVYAEEQLILLDRIENALNRTVDHSDRLGFVRAIDQQLAILHGHKLEYPLELLVLGIAEALAGAPPVAAARRAVAGSTRRTGIPIKTLAQSFLNHIRRRIPNLREGVFDALSQIHKMNVVTVVATEGKIRRCRKLIAYYELTQYVTRVVEGEKTPNMFAEIAAIYEYPPNKFVVGDQLDRDISPGKTAGYRTIYFPGEFKPLWERRSSAQPDFTVSSFSEVSSIIARIGAPRRASRVSRRET